MTTGTTASATNATVVRFLNSTQSSTWQYYPTYAFATGGIIHRCGLSGVKVMPEKNVRVYHLIEGNWFVRGTMDIEEIKALLEQDDDVREVAPEDSDWEIKVEGIQWGRYRFVPCAKYCGEHSWHVVPWRTGTSPRGTFVGAMLEQVIPVPVEFDMDLPSGETLEREAV